MMWSHGDHESHRRGGCHASRWEPQFLNTGARVQPGHLQIESVDPHRVPMPITARGYLSWFTSPALVQDSGGPVAFVLQWLDAEASGPAWAQAETGRRQLSLFG